MGFKVENVRQSFPILNQTVHGQPLVYLDNAATTQKPIDVIHCLKHYYEHDNANVHRGVHTLSQRATVGYEGTREKVRQYIGAKHVEEVVFTKGATESINLVANTFAKDLNLQPGDEVLVSIMEHHSNFVPWQSLCQETGATLKILPMTEKGDIDLTVFKSHLTANVKLLAIAHASNAIGTVNPVKTFTRLAKEKSIPVLIDGTQAVQHLAVNVVDLDCDFYVFSSHKMYGPTGVGVLYGKKALLEAMSPYQMGGDMIKEVLLDSTVVNDPPYKFEAGTPNVAGVTAFGAALDFLTGLGLEAISKYEQELREYACNALSNIDGLAIVGEPNHAISVISFVMEGVHPHDIGTILDQSGVAVRAGHHCAMPLMRLLNVPGTVRMSMTFYNTFEEIDKAVLAINEVKKVFGL